MHRGRRLPSSRILFHGEYLVKHSTHMPSLTGRFAMRQFEMHPIPEETDKQLNKKSYL
jgi:hypothetical protein